MDRRPGFVAHPSRRARERAPQDEAEEKLPSTLRDELGDQIGAETLDAAFAAMAGFLDAAERRLWRRDGDRIDADHAGLQRVADGGRGRARRGEGIGRKTELQRVGALDHLVEGLE